LSDDHKDFKELRRQMSTDIWNTVAVAELENDWLHARDLARQTFDTCNEASCLNFAKEDLNLRGTRVIHLGSTITNVVVEAVDGSLVAANVATRGAAGLEVASSSNLARASNTMRFGSVASKALGVFGAVAATGIAVHGWCSTKLCQQAVQSKLSELTSSLLHMQRWLAGLDDLECPICLENLSLADEAQRCSNNWHYFHSRCLREWCQDCETRQLPLTCPSCRGDLSGECKRLDDFITGDIRTHLVELSI